MIRVSLFFLTNLAAIVIFGLLLNLLEFRLGNVQELLVFSLLFGFSGSFISLLCSKWIALKSVNGKIIQYPNSDTEWWLIKTISQQAKKIGISVPQVAVYHSSCVNAFTTGMNRNNALLAISTSLLQNFNRDELEAVIAHEMSHIANGDMVTMTLIQGVINTFVIFISHTIAHIVSNVFSNNYNSDKEESISNNTLVYVIISTILKIIFGILANVIVMWFSRNREFYADEGSASLVGREKIISALQHLKNNCYNLQESSNTITVFCINGKSKSWSVLFMTHPPLSRRIKALRNKEYQLKTVKF